MKNVFVAIFATVALLCLNFEAKSQVVESVSSKWFENIRLGGYTQLRYNRLFETNEDLTCEQCDKSLGKGKGFFLRRARIRLAGNLSKRVYAYLQFDMATAFSNSIQHGLGLKDAYFDLALNDERSHRIRFGQSKIPYGFENMQSSSNRLALDRNDAINSAAKDERDLGAFYYYTPVEIRKRLSFLTRSGLKGSGDYGMFGFGLYNGQGAGRIEQNDNLHVIARFTYPFLVGEMQIIEAGIQGYKGKYSVSLSEVNENRENLFADERVAASLTVYPQPFGFQGEYNIGKGPEYNALTNRTEEQSLTGGYAQLMYRYAGDKHTFIPFLKYQYYDGGKKFELDARSYLVRQTEIGVEWQWDKFELVGLYSFEDRNYVDGLKPVNHQVGSRFRLQAQFNY
ncbi:porin [Jiulongibacter sediminis]|uniref:porin n=1 Tax=Jiulongibacter sediminis TaxID=1605367 RepID=UPI0026F2C6EC|nr:porin [Jiulongibacter sediminis]